MHSFWIYFEIIYWCIGGNFLQPLKLKHQFRDWSGLSLLFFFESFIHYRLLQRFFFELGKLLKVSWILVLTHRGLLKEWYLLVWFIWFAIWSIFSNDEARIFYDICINYHYLVWLFSWSFQDFRGKHSWRFKFSCMG